jgi:hypothetical protein
MGRNRKNKAERKRIKGEALDPKEARYAAELIKPGVTKVEAARRAGLDYVPKRPRVQRAVQTLVRQQLTVAQITAERILLEVFRSAVLDPADLYDEDDHLLPVRQMPEDARRALHGFDIRRVVTSKKDEDVETTIEKVRLAKIPAQEMMMKHLGLLDKSSSSDQKDRLHELVMAMTNNAAPPASSAASLELQPKKGKK